MTPDELRSLQGNLIGPYGASFGHVAHLFGRIEATSGGSFRALFRRLLGPQGVTWGLWEQRPARTLNVGVSAQGLQALQPALATELAHPFRAFTEGMPARAATLGDPNPLAGRWGERHLWLTINAINAEELDAAVGALRELAHPVDLVEETRGAAWVVDGHWHEHFGFRDDISYPAVVGLTSPTPEELEGRGQLVNGTWQPIAPGEFVLGFRNNAGVDIVSTLSPDAKRLLRGGSFAVLRKLKQDVVAFRDYIDSIRQRVPGDPAAKLVGRERGGEPLAPLDAVGEGHDSLNNFTFERDQYGARCPLGSHVRRANHRSNNDGGRHRLMRRGMNYGTPLAEGARDDKERGLWFLAFNADIEDQFEFVQKRWLNGPVSNLSDEQDPLAGMAAKRAMAIEGDSAQHRAPVLLRNIPQFVSFLGGQYYFYPGRSGIELLAEPAQPVSGARRLEPQ
jgi:Dyp-type peroxidase family